MGGDISVVYVIYHRAAAAKKHQLWRRLEAAQGKFALENYLIAVVQRPFETTWPPYCGPAEPPRH
jgi:hypothetical protein